eukprot:14198942-Ditylum_brightwellii.AAC.1
MLAACGLVRFYNDIRRALTPTNMRWEVVKDFKQQIEALEKCCKEDGPKVHKIPKGKFTKTCHNWSSRELEVTFKQT